MAAEMDSSFPGWQQELAWPERASHCLAGSLSQYIPGGAMLELAFFYYPFQVLESLPSSHIGSYSVSVEIAFLSGVSVRQLWYKKNSAQKFPEIKNLYIFCVSPF